MMVSTKGRYALRVMLDLALNGGQEKYVSLADIAARQEISLKYLEAIVSALSKADFLESHRGKSGGYRLTRPTGSYTVGEILMAAEGSLAPVSCLEGEPCKRAGRCLTFPVWKELDKRIDEYLESVTLSDVLNGEVSGK